MDRTLRSYMQQADEVYDYLDKYCLALSADQIEAKVIELQANIKTIQAVAYHLANISNIANRVVIRKRRTKKSTLAEVVQNTKKYIDPYPTEYDVGTLRSLNPMESKEIVKGVDIPICTVEKTQDIPVSHLYYVKETKQFALNVEGIVICGNLGNIVEYGEDNSAACEYGINCKSFVGATECSYYHNPSDYLHYKLPVPDQVRNFTIGSWIYSKKKTPKTYFTRHLGSADRLIYDLNTLKSVQYREEISNREGQLIHDLLIYMVLNTRGLLSKYPHWDKKAIKAK